MNICITPNSIKLFGSFISRKLPNQLTPEKTAEALLNDLFNDALTVFSDNGLSKQRNKELVLQHMSIVPQIVLKHISDNPKLGTVASFDKFKSLANDVIKASEDKSTKSFQKLIDDFGGFIGNDTIVLTSGDPLDRFEAISTEILKTSNQEAVFDPIEGYAENILDPEKAFEFAVSRNVIKSGNNLSYRFILSTLGEVINDPSFVNTTGSKDLNTPVLVLVDIQNKVVKFDENGLPSQTGKSPIFTIKTNKKSLQYQVEIISKQLIARDKLSESEAKQIAQKQVDSFINYVNTSLERTKKGESVFLNLDMANSSLGFIAQDRNNCTELSKISNINDGQTQIEQHLSGIMFYPVISVANTNKRVRVFENALSTLTDEEFEALHYLIAEDTLVIEGFSEATANNKPTRRNKSTREEFMNFFIDSYAAGNFHYYIQEEEVDGKKIQTRMVRLGNKKAIPANELTLQELKDFANQRWYREIDPKNINPEESAPKASVKDTKFIGEYFYGDDGKVYEVLGVRRSFTNDRKHNMDSIIYKVPTKVVDGVLQRGPRITIGEHVKNVGYTNLVPTGENKLIGVGAYLAFTQGVEEIVPVTIEEVKLKDEIDKISWRSIPARNMATIATSEQDKKALSWFNSKTNPLNQVVGVNFIDEASEFGPNFVANFVNGMINMYKGSAGSDIYHEAFHAFFDGILTPSERTEILDTIRKTPGYFTTVVNGKNKIVAFSEAEDIDIEEYLAEKFREYALADGKKPNFSNNKIIAFFQKLLNLLKSVFGNMTYAEARALNKTQGMVDAIFSDLFNGNFTADMFALTTQDAKWKSSEIETKTGDEFSLEEMHSTMKAMKSILADFVTQGLNISHDKSIRIEAVKQLFVMASTPKDSELYKNASDKLTALEKGGSIRSGSGMFTLATNPDLLGYAVKYIRTRLEQQQSVVDALVEQMNAVENKTDKQVSESKSLNYQKQLLDKILKPENFGKLSDLNVNQIADKSQQAETDSTLIQVFLKNYSNLVLKKNAYEDKYEDQAVEEEVYVPQWDRSGNDQLFDELIDEHTKNILDSIHAYTEQGRGVAIIDPVLGFKEMLPLKNAIAKVAKVLRNTPDAMEMCKKLKKAAETDKEMDQIFRRLGDISDVQFADLMSAPEHKQWSEFWQVFNKADVFLREFIMEREITGDEFDEFVIKHISKSGKSSSLSMQITRMWGANFKFNLFNSTYAEEVDGVPVFNLEDFYDDFHHYRDKVPDKWFARIEGPGADFVVSKLDPNKGSSKTSRYTTDARFRSEAMPFEFLEKLGIEIVDDPDVRKILFEGSEELGISSSIIKNIAESIKNRQKKVIWDDQQGKYVLDPGRNYVTSLDDVFKTFKYEGKDEKGNSVILTQSDTFGYLKQLRELHYAYSNDYTNFSSYNATGELQSEKSFNSSLLNQVASLNLASSLDELLAVPGMEYLDPRYNPQSAACKWFIDMFQLDPTVHSENNRGKRDWSIKISVENLSGSKIIEKYNGYVDSVDEFGNKTGERERNSYEIDNGVESIKSDAKTKFITDFHLTLEGKQEIMRSEAKSTSLSVFTTSRKGTQSRKGTDLLVNREEIEKIFEKNSKAKILYGEFKNHIAAEIIRIQNIRKLKNMIISGQIKPEDLAIDVKQLNRGDDWFMFDKIFDADLKKALEAFEIEQVYSDKTFSIDGLSDDLKVRIDKALTEYFKNEAKLLKDEKDSKLLISDNLLEKYSTDAETLEKNEKTETIDDVKDRMYRAFVVNNFLQNANYSSLFLGDVTVHDVEGEAFHKRIAGLISTGKIFRHDDVWMNFINSETYNAKGFAKKHNASKNIQLDYSYNGFIKTAIIKEARLNSPYAKQYRELFGVDTEKYDDEKEDGAGAMEIADGQGYISFDMYRILNDSIGEWSEAQENLYQKMLNGSYISPEEMVTTFPARKFQAFGNVSNEKSDALLKGLGISLQNTAFHKYSLIPLIPALIKDTALETMHERMMEQGIDYVTMQSGSKLSTLSKVKVVENEKGEKKIVADVDDFYDAKTQTIVADDNFEFTPNVIHVKSLKSQIFLAEGYKGHITLPTQLRKIALIGIMDGGVPVDFKHEGPGTAKEAWDKLSKQQKLKASKKWVWYTEYTDTLDEMEKVLKDQLLEDLEMKEVVVKGVKQYTGDSTRLVAYLQDQLRSKEMLPEEIAYIAKPDGTLIDDLSLTLISEKLEELLVTMVDKKLRRLSVNGEALVQVSNVMYNKRPEFRKASPEDIESFRDDDLKFYYLKNPDGSIATDTEGNKLVQKMEIKISLQGDYKKLLYLKHPDGETIATYITNEDGKVVLDYNASLARLNQAIKDQDWLVENEKLITIPGVRIPTQGPNALVAAVVAEFLPEWAGPIIILPAEIVAQSGADYDIDKLFSMFKNLVMLNRKVQEIEYDPTVTETYTELRASLQTFNDKLQEAENNLNERWKDYTNYLDSKSVLNEDVKSMRSTISVIQEEINDKRDLMKQISENPAYPLDTKRTTLDFIQTEIDALNSSITYLRKQTQQKTVDLFGKKITSKEEREAVTSEMYEKHMRLIKEAEDKLDAAYQNKTEIERRIASKGIKGLENKLSNLLADKILDPDNLPFLITPNTTKDVEGKSRRAGRKIAKSYNKLANKKNSTSADGKIAKTSIFEYRYNLLKHQENSVGIDALGIAAVATTFYALFTTFGATLQETSESEQTEFENALKLLQDPSKSHLASYTKAIELVSSFNNKKLKFVKPDGTVGYNLNVEANALSLGAMTNADGKQISDILSQLVNGYVDVAKDAWIFDTQGTKENTPTLLFLVMAGVSTDAIIDMVNNPLVLEFNENRKELEGVFATLGNDSLGGITIPKKYQAAVKMLEEKWNTLFTEKSEHNPLHITSFNATLIANSSPELTNELLESRVGQQPNFQDVVILANYLQIEKMAQELNKFTQLSKYDTTKVSNISEAQNRIEDIEDFKLTKISKKIIPDAWFDKINEGPVGKFNQDSFMLDLFSKYFKIRNNKALLLSSLDIKPPKGVERRKILGDFKNDFLWFLYQNAVYGTDSYTVEPTIKVGGIVIPGKSYKLIEDDTISEPYIVNEETNEVRYKKNIMLEDKSMLEFHYSSKFFRDANAPKDWVRFKLEYSNLLQATANLTDSEFKEKFYQFDNGSKSFFDHGSKYARMVILQRAALYYTNNINAMFDLSAGIGFIIKNMITQNPDLKNYAFFRDLNYDFNESLKKMNIYFPQIKDVQLASVYRENLTELRNHPSAEVRELVNKITHIAIMQAGMNRSSKYDIAKLTDQSLFSDIIESEIGLPYINSVMDDLAKQYEDREKRKNGQIIDQFKKLYLEKIKGNGMRIKVRGANYTVNKLNFKDVNNLKQSEIGYSNITILGVNKKAEVGQDELKVDYFYSEPTMTPMDVAQAIKDMEWVIPNKKIIAPEGQNQKELDKALSFLGIDNSKELPTLKYKSKNAELGFLSIANSAVQKGRYVIIDDAMANSATKAIGQATLKDAKGLAFNPKYDSSSDAYAVTLEQEYPGSLAKVKFTENQFDSLDKVWVFGSTITENAYRGRTEAEFTEALQKTFNTYHKPLILKALEAGVETFYVGTASGIDAMTLAFLQEQRYSPVVRYTKAGTYYEVVPMGSVKNVEGQNFDTESPEIFTKNNKELNTLFDEIYDSQYGKTPKWFTELTTSELLNSGLTQVEEKIKAAIVKLDGDFKSQNQVGFRLLFAASLANLGTGRLMVGNSLFDSMVEQVLMKFRKAVLDKNASLVDQEQKRIQDAIDKTVLEPTANNERYNSAVVDYLTELNAKPLKVGDKVNVYFKNSDNDQDLTISFIQKLDNKRWRIKLSTGEKEYTYIVDNEGNNDKIEIHTFTEVSTNVYSRTTNYFEKVPGALEFAQTKLDAYERRQEPFRQGYLSTPIISTVEETYEISESISMDPNNKDLNNTTRKPVETRTGYKITFAEHPDAVFYLTPNYYFIGDEKNVNGWKIENINSGVKTNQGPTIEMTVNTFASNFKKLQNVSLANDKLVDIINKTGMDINKLIPSENAQVKYTYLTLPFSMKEKETILANFTEKYFKGKNPYIARKYIEDALEEADDQKQKEIIELLKACYK